MSTFVLTGKQHSNMSIDGKSGSSEDDTLLSVKKAVEQPLIVLWERLEEWQQDNHYIRSGYRPATNSYKKSIASLTYLHTETFNIWSHLIGTVLFALGGPILYFALKQRYEEASSTDVLVFLCFFLGAIVCMGMSATFHTITNHSPTVSKFGNQLDYFGIVFLIVGSFIPSIHYGFTCDPPLITTYWTMIITIGAGCGITTFSPKFASPKWRPFRASMFVAMGLSAIFPVIHGLKLYGLEPMVGLIGLPWLVSQGAMYVLGAVLYAMRVPERFKPGQFDIWGSSHQIFHFLVVAAAITHLIGLVKAFDYHYSNSMQELCPVYYSGQKA